MSERLDDLLREPLPEISDNGFSAHVYARIEAEQLRSSAVTLIVTAICAVAVILFLPVREIVEIIVLEIPKIVSLPGVYIAAAAIALSLLLDKEIAQP